MNIVTYEVSSREVIDSYWEMIRNSSRYRLKILRFSLLIFVLPFAIELGIRKEISSISVLIAITFAIASPLLAVYFGRKLARKGPKTISLSDDGMSVSIGDNSSYIKWDRVGGVEESDNFLFILSKTGNFMCVPKMAFKTKESFTDFKLELCKKT